MANYIVSYDLNGPFPTHQQVDDLLRSISVKYGRLLETVWYLQFEGSTVELRSQIDQILSLNDRLLVIEIGDAAWRNLLVANAPLLAALQEAA